MEVWIYFYSVLASRPTRKDVFLHGEIENVSILEERSGIIMLFDMNVCRTSAMARGERLNLYSVTTRKIL